MSQRCVLDLTQQKKSLMSNFYHDIVHENNHKEKFKQKCVLRYM